jgi:chitinase
MSAKQAVFPWSTIYLLIAAMLAPRSVVAARPTCALTTGVVGSGSVEPASGIYRKNNIITITAIPDPEWVFDHWEGYLSGAENPTAIRFTSDVNVVAVFVESGPPTPTPSPTPDPSPTPNPTGKEIIGYFIQWGVYRRDYHVKNIVTSGSADILTTINYAFAGIGDDLQCEILDAYADYEKRYDAAESVDGVADLVSQPLKGSFNQLKKLKAIYPHIRVVISVGGWSDSAKFSDAALPENRTAFVSSCIDLFIRGNFDPANGVVDPGVFDGIDIDWEYPGACGATCNHRSEDTENFTALLAEFRTQLDAIDPNLLLTIAAPASEHHYSKIELEQVHQYLDWINLMTYDFHGGWEPQGPTNHHANLHASPADPSQPPMSATTAVQGYLAGGVPADKLTLGLPFYGHGWTRVPNVDDGLYQPAGGLPRGTWQKGIEDFEVLEAKGYPGFWDPLAQAHWIYNGKTFWSYDNADSVAAKMDYINGQELRGVMFWELSGDDPGGTLVSAIGNGLHGVQRDAPQEAGSSGPSAQATQEPRDLRCTPSSSQ